VTWVAPWTRIVYSARHLGGGRWRCHRHQVGSTGCSGEDDLEFTGLFWSLREVVVSPAVICGRLRRRASPWVLSRPSRILEASVDHLHPWLTIAAGILRSRQAARRVTFWRTRSRDDNVRWWERSSCEFFRNKSTARCIQRRVERTRSARARAFDQPTGKWRIWRLILVAGQAGTWAEGGGNSRQAVLPRSRTGLQASTMTWLYEILTRAVRRVWRPSKRFK
jgi:hypothetical protein